MKNFLLPLTFLSIYNLSQAQNVNIPDQNFKNALLNIDCVDSNLDGILDSNVDTNNDDEISIQEALAVKNLNLRLQGITSLEGLEAFVNVDSLNISQNYILSSVDVSNMSKLKSFNCSTCNLNNIDLSQNPELYDFVGAGNSFGELDFSNNPKLKNIGCTRCDLTSIDVSNLNELERLVISYNNIFSLEVKNKPLLREIYCSNGPLEELLLSNLPKLELLYSFNSNLTKLDIRGMSSLKKVSCHESQLTELLVTGTESLEQLLCQENYLTEVVLDNHPKLRTFWCFDNQIQFLDLSAAKNLWSFSCQNNQIKKLELIDFPHLYLFDCNKNDLDSLTIINADSVKQIQCTDNNLQSLELIDMPHLTNLNARNNKLKHLDLTDSDSIEYLRINNNQFSFLDLSQFKFIKIGDCSNNPLKNLILKNGVVDDKLNFSSNRELQYICIDDNEEEYINNYLESFHQTGVEINTYCYFESGSNFGYATGNFYYDELGGNCNTTLRLDEYVKMNISSIYDTGYIIHHTSKPFSIPLTRDSFLITPTLENSDYFEIIPKSININYPGDANPFAQDFCIRPLGEFNDLSINIIPLDIPRPGFDASYQIKYSNLGTTSQSGSIMFVFMDNLMDFVEASQMPFNQSTNQLSWNFENLKPFESRTITIQVILNTPTDNPPLNNGDLISFHCSISSLVHDENFTNNSYTLEETVVNSFDPNDKTCLQGSTISLMTIDEFIHYKIRFENEGTATARNIVITDTIDYESFDISTIGIVDASHDVRLRTVGQNNVEFIFENIELPFEDEANDGYVVFKIKLRNHLFIGDEFENSASIYFDFNHPIKTNIAQSIIIDDSEEDNDLDGSNSNEDCNDYNSSIYPGNIEIPYNGIDDDCNTATLDDDLDQDGYSIIEDCDDQNALVYPNADELCDSIDNNCNDIVDEGLLFWIYKDEDEDGFGDPNSAIEVCDTLLGYVINNTDCDDNNFLVNTNQEEIVYNGLNDDCDNFTLDDDLDQDGYNIAEDCDDNNSEINPSALEIPNNGIDEDCDGNDLLTSITNLKNTNIKIYPNPFSNFVYVKGDVEIQEINVLDYLGNSILKLSNHVQDVTELNLSHIPPSIYILRIKTNQGYFNTFLVKKE